MPGNNLKLEPWGKDDPAKDESLPQVPGAINDKAASAWQRAGSPASGGQGVVDFDEPPSPRPRSPNLHKRMVLTNRDKESLLEEIIDLKKALSDQAYHLRLHRVHASAVQIENRKLEKDIEDLEVSGSYEAPRTGGPTRLRSKLQGLKVRLGDLQATCDLQHDELCALRRDIRVTRTREVEVERDIYAGEIGRLQKVVRRLKALSARITIQNRELQRLKDKAARLELANQRLESCIAVVHKTLERANKEVTSYRSKANESQLEAKKYNKKITELQEHAAVLEGLLEKERTEKRKIAQRIKAVAVKKREWDKEFQAKQKRNQLASTADAFRKKKKKKKLKSKRKDKEGDASGASSTTAGETSSSDSDESSHGQISYEEFEARKLSFLSKVETASHSFVAQEKDVYGQVVNRTLPSGALGSHGYGSGGPYGGASGEYGSASGPRGGRGHGDQGGPGGYTAGANVGGYGGLSSEGGSGEHRVIYGGSAEAGSRGYDARGYGEGRQGENNVGGYGRGIHGQGGQGGPARYGSEGESGSPGGIGKGSKEDKVGKAGKDGKRGKSGKSGPSTTSTTDYGSSGGEQRSRTGTLSSGSDSSLLLSPDDKKREEDVEGTFYEGVDTAAEEFMDSVEAMVGGTGKVPKLNLERIKAREAAEAKRREEQRLRRETEERLIAQEQEGKRLAAELAEERRLSAQKIEAETERRLKLIAAQGNLEIEIDHERLQSDEFESEIKTDTGGRLCLQINLKRSSEHPYPGSPRAQAEAEAEAERQKIAAEAEAQKEEAVRMKAEIEAREEAVKRSERESMLRKEEENRKELVRQQQEAMHEAELRKKAEDDVQKKMAQEAAAKIATEEAAKVLAWIASLNPEQLEEYRRRVAGGENPVDIMKSMQLAAKLKAWESTLTPEQSEEYRRRVAAGEDPTEVMKSMQLAAKIKAWEATLTPEQLQEFRSRVLAGEIPEDVMKMMQWESTLTPEQLAEFRRRVANGENSKEVMKSMQLSAFEATLTPEELAEYQRRIALGEDPYAIMEAMMAIKRKKNQFQFLDKDMQGFIKENIRGVLCHLENITEVIVHKQEELGMHKEAASTATGAAIDVLKASEREAEKKRKKKKEVHIQEQEDSSSAPGTPRKEKKGESSRGGYK